MNFWAVLQLKHTLTIMLMSAEMKQTDACCHQLASTVKATQLPLGYVLQQSFLSLHLD